MRLLPPPAAASWVHHGVRSGFEIAFFRQAGDGNRLVGHTTAEEERALWSVGYDVELDEGWRTRRVRASTVSIDGRHEVLIQRDPQGGWTVDGEPRPDLDGCVDIDFESSAVTNALPVRRLDPVAGEGIDVPAVFVRAEDLRVERLEQRYTLRDAARDPLREGAGDGPSFLYESATFDFSCELRYDRSGLVLEYPGIAVRHS
ncbi:hypothetical protein J2Y69_001068 [Microbacterium resistens]|uniref:Glycolipid-binding domain-containing protein n=1 Tax=Microbacterium resistens TaxID=156977 RepID=A0ABU1SA46_9MICO|nr:putative glycolipid-binding domain-containing protein [Microbacterium resistens]MDR6866476.1 hypothetical protein [Microbacterium resistens]